MLFAVEAQHELASCEDWPQELLDLPACRPQWAPVPALGSVGSSVGAWEQRRGEQRDADDGRMLVRVLPYIWWVRAQV